jgi:WD40 repeat protein
MSLGKQWKLPAIGCIALTTLTILLLRPGCTGRRPAEAEEQRSTVLGGHRAPVEALAFAPDGTTLVSAACFLNAPELALEVAVWDVTTGRRLTQRTEQVPSLRGLAFAPGGRGMAAAHDGTLWLWDPAQAYDQGRRFERPADVCAAAFSDDGGQLALADLANDVTVLEPKTGRLRGCLKGQDEGVSALAFAPDGVVLAGGGLKGTVWLWDTAAGEGRGVLQGHTKPVWAVAFSRDGRWLVSGDGAGVVRLWDVTEKAAGTTLATSTEEVDVTAVTFAPDSRTLAVAVGRAVQLWDVATGRLLVTLRGHQGQVRCLAYSPGGTRLASGSCDKTVRLWDVTRYRSSLP